MMLLQFSGLCYITADSFNNSGILLLNSFNNSGNINALILQQRFY